MIQVLQRAVKIMEMFSERRFMSFSDISARCEYQKTTLSNILKTLVELDVLKKIRRDEYTVGSKWVEMGMLISEKDPLVEAARKVVADITRKTGYGASVIKFTDGAILRVAKSFYSDNGMVVQHEAEKRYSLSSISCYVLLANIGNKERESFIKGLSFPLSGIPEIKNKRALIKFLSEIKNQGWGYRPYSKNEMASFAMPVIDDDLKVVCVLGLFLPVIFSNRSSNEETLDFLRSRVEEVKRMVGTG
jgi:DNA-binding IclR family transcriptional regulator